MPMSGTIRLRSLCRLPRRHHDGPRGFGRFGQAQPAVTISILLPTISLMWIEQTGVRDATLVGYSMGGGKWCAICRGITAATSRRSALSARPRIIGSKTENNPVGIDGAVFDGIKQGVQGDRKA